MKNYISGEEPKVGDRVIFADNERNRGCSGKENVGKIGFVEKIDGDDIDFFIHVSGLPCRNIPGYFANRFILLGRCELRRE